MSVKAYKLQSCKYCGCDKMEINSNGNPLKIATMFWAQCPSCFARGPIAGNTRVACEKHGEVEARKEESH